MAFVVDASVALAWCFDDEESPYASHALALLKVGEGFAPSIWPLEIANALRSAEQRGRIDEREVPSATRLLAALPIKVETLGLDRTLSHVLPLARAAELSAYDAAYVDLALRMNLPLATADDFLAHAAVAAGADLLGDRAT
jgi:predicted nucleic acid-binding protein